MACSILQMIAEGSQVTAAQGMWDFLKPVAGMRNLSVAKNIDTLRDHFSLKQLESARVLVRGAGNQLKLNAVLEGETPRGLFLRSTEDGAPFDIVNQNGSLANDDPPAFACLRDIYTRRYSGGARSILVVFGDDDLVVSRMLALPCAPGAGLNLMNGEQLRRFFESLSNCADGTSDPKQSAASVSCGDRLILTGWCMAELKNELPSGAVSVIERLLIAEEAFGVDTSRWVRVWQPGARDFRRIRSAVEFQDRSLARRLIGQSVGRSTRSAKQFQEESANRNTPEYDVVRRELLDTIKQARKLGMQSADVSKRLEALNRAFDENVVDAIIRDAMSSPNSVERALMLAASELMDHWHNSSQLVRSTRRSVSERRSARDVALDSEELKQRLSMVEGLVKIHRELTRNK